MSSKPIRLQLSRRAGFNLQQHSLSTNGLPAVKVARPSIFGNPFKVELARDLGYRDPQAHAVQAFRKWLDWHVDYRLYDEQRIRLIAAMDALKGKNLACFCRPDQCCHADILMSKANEGWEASRDIA